MARGERPRMTGDIAAGLHEKFLAVNNPVMKDSGSEGFNTVISDGLGIPAGTLIELTAEYGLGKTTACLHIARRYCDRGEQVYWLDHEQGVNDSQLNGMGLAKYMYHPQNNPQGLFHLLAPATFEEADTIMKELLDLAPGMIVIDSVTAMAPGKLLDKGVEEIEPGLQARYQSNFLMKYKPKLKELGITVWLINQVRTQIRFMGATTLEPSGGNALKHWCDVRLMMQLDERLKKTTETPDGKKEAVQYGTVVSLFAIKNRYAVPYIKVPVAILFGRGISNLYSYIQFLMSQGIVSLGPSGVYSIKLPSLDGQEPVKKRGYPALEAFIKENVKEVREIISAAGGFKLKKEEMP